MGQLPAASADASSLSCRNGLMIRPENADANPSATRSVISLLLYPRPGARPHWTRQIRWASRPTPAMDFDHGRRPGDALDMVRPGHGRVGFLRRQVEGGDFVFKQVATDPGCVVVAEDDGPFSLMI